MNDGRERLKFGFALGLIMVVSGLYVMPKSNPTFTSHDLHTWLLGFGFLYMFMCCLVDR